MHAFYLEHCHEKVEHKYQITQGHVTYQLQCSNQDHTPSGDWLVQFSSHHDERNMKESGTSMTKSVGFSKVYKWQVGSMHCAVVTAMTV